MEYLFSLKNLNGQIGFIYRNTKYNYLLHTNFSKKSEGKSTDFYQINLNQIFRLKFGFIKQCSFNRDFEGFLAGRVSFFLNNGKELEYNNNLFKLGLLHKNFSSFVLMQNSKLAIEKIYANFYLNKFNFYFENAKLFGEAEYKKNNDYNESDFKVSIGSQIEINEDSLIKLKLSNFNMLDMSLSNKINNWMKVVINFQAKLKENDNGNRNYERMMKCKTGVEFVFE